MSAQPGGESRKFVIYAAVLILVTIGVIVLLRPDSSEKAIDDGRPHARDDVTSAEPTATATPRKKKKAKATESGDLPEGFGTSFPGLGMQPGGIRGDGASYSLEKHQVTIRWTASHPLGLVAYIVPTSTNNSRGSHVEQASSWSTTTVAFGKPDYAVAYVQARADGQPVTCEIIVDGRVTDRRSTVGPYGSVWCQG